MKKPSEKARISDMIEAVMKVARGDYSAQVELTDKNDELDSLAMGINMMIDDIRNNYQELQASQAAQATSLNIVEDLDLEKRELEGLTMQLQQEIVERKRAEEARLQLMNELETKNKELNDFAYIVSHDLKAPLRGISSLAEWISTDYSDKLDDDGREQMTLLLNRVKRMHGLIDGILQYSRIGRIVEEKQEIDLNLLVDEVIDTLDPPENITVDVLNELPTVMFEPTRIGQVFQNLIGNAVKYMDKKGGKITVDCQDDVECWKFSIVDNGPGIDEKYHDKIFQIFQTLKPRDEFESTGIGLTIVKKIIDANGGKIWVDSKVGEGTTFYFTNPK